MANDKLVHQPTNALTALSAPQREHLGLLLVALQAGSRELSGLELSFWTETLVRYPLPDVETVIREFMATATRDEARGMVLGDLTKPLNVKRAERMRQQETADMSAKLEQWKAEYDAEGPEREAWLKQQAKERAAAMAMDTSDEAARQQELQRQKVALARESK